MGINMSMNRTVSALVGQKVKSLRRDAGYTASQFSKLTGCKSEQQLYRYERGINKIDIDTLASALKVLNVNIEFFFEQVMEEAYKEPIDYNIKI